MSSPAVASCPDDEVIANLVGGALSPAERAAVELHIDTCEACRKVVGVLGRLDVPPALRPGDVVDGKYRVERLLGEGGMGMVVEATHLALGHRVAVKVMVTDASPSPEMVARFVREAKAAARLRSDHVARVLDIGTLPTGTPYYVMELLTGQDLGRLSAREGKLSATRAVGLVLQALEGLAEAHATGIVHRDLKPQNLFLAESPGGRHTVKILDFGISKFDDGSDATSTDTKAVMGSPLYMPPEQLASAKAATVRSDLYAMGCVLYELLSGKTPFAPAPLPELVTNVLHQPVSPIVGVDARLGRVVMRCLAKDEAARFASTSELAFALAPFADDGDAAALRIAQLIGTPPESAATTARWPLLLLALALVIAGVVGIRWLVRPNVVPSTTAAPNSEPVVAPHAPPTSFAPPPVTPKSEPKPASKRRAPAASPSDDDVFEQRR